MKVSSIQAIILALFSLSLPACDLHKEGQSHQEHQQIVVTTPKVMDVIITQPYVCQIHSQTHVNVRALQDGYLQKILVKEGQPVKKDEVMFEVNPVLYEAKYRAKLAEAELAQIKYDNTKKLYDEKVVSVQDLMQHKAELDRAKAEARLAERELNFTKVTAPFDGIVDRLHEQLGSLVKKEDILTTLSDNRLMWVYFNVPERRYLEYKAREGKSRQVSRLELRDSTIELVLADGSKFNQTAGNTVTVEANFNHETGNLPFRADFPNPDGLLRNGQTGTVLIHRSQKNALVIPQRATFELLDKRYVWVIGYDEVAHQRLITIENELEDTFVIKSGLDVSDKIVLDGVREVHEDEKVEYEFRKPEIVLSRENQKFRAE